MSVSIIALFLRTSETSMHIWLSPVWWEAYWVLALNWLVGRVRGNRGLGRKTERGNLTQSLSHMFILGQDNSLKPAPKLTRKGQGANQHHTSVKFLEGGGSERVSPINLISDSLTLSFRIFYVVFCIFKFLWKPPLM